MKWRWTSWRIKPTVEAEFEEIRSQLAAALRLAELSEHSPHALVVHCDGVICWANKEAAHLVGIVDPAQVVGRSVCDFVDPRSAARTEDRIKQVLADGGTLGSAEAFLRTQSGATIVVETRAARTVWDGRPAVQVVIWDVTERHRFRTQLEWEASHDPLTGLWNRRAVLRHLEELLAAGASGEIAVALVDLKGFKSVNDTLGHPTGDRVLSRVATELQSMAGSWSTGRLGGDEFLIVCPSGAPAARELAARIEAELHLDRVEGIDLPAAVTATVGVAAGPCTEVTIERLLSAADSDLYSRRQACREPTATHC